MLLEMCVIASERVRGRLAGLPSSVHIGRVTRVRYRDGRSPERVKRVARLRRYTEERREGFGPERKAGLIESLVTSAAGRESSRGSRSSGRPRIAGDARTSERSRSPRSSAVRDRPKFRSCRRRSERAGLVGERSFRVSIVGGLRVGARPPCSFANRSLGSLPRSPGSPLSRRPRLSRPAGLPSARRASATLGRLRVANRPTCLPRAPLPSPYTLAPRATSLAARIPLSTTRKVLLSFLFFVFVSFFFFLLFCFLF